MKNVKLRFRQVHLDFHTSPVCEDVGANFDPTEFAETVKMGHVDSMTIFAKCHHGYSYYPTKVGTMHPHLKFDLMGQQIEALHSVNVRAPIYISLMWDDLAGELHPEWVMIDKNGKAIMRPPTSGDWGWTTVDPTSGYGDYVMAQADEIARNYPVDGLFFDICFPIINYSTWAQTRLHKAGIRLDDESAVNAFGHQLINDYIYKLSNFVRERVPDATLYFNGTVNAAMSATVAAQSHLEIESLPTSGHWGYMHYPVFARQARANDVDFLGMTGRFHKSWADFGGLKTFDQLDYECGTIVGAGGKISVGDQLHPNGVLDPAVYRLLGQSFSRVEQLEPWLDGAIPVAEVAILTGGHERRDPRFRLQHSEDVEGAAQLLLEAAIQYDILDPTAAKSFQDYKALILPNGLAVDDDLRGRLETFLASGGKLVMSGTAALNPTSGEFDLPGVPVTYVGPAPTVPSYLRLDETLAGESELATDYDYVFYEQAYQVKPVAGASAYGELRQALFNRTWEHFTSHRHAPVGASLNSPLVVANENILYFAAPFFSAYRDHDYWAYRATAVNALRMFLPAPELIPSGPGWVEFTLHNQDQRKIVHVVAYHPRRSSQSIQHVDQSWSTSGLSVKVLTGDRVPTQAYLAPERLPLPFKQEGEYTRINLPSVGAHAVIVLE